MIACLWLGAAALGLRQLWAYAQRSGQQGNAQAAWPAESSLQRDADRATLLMFVHPMCPCSKASVEELARVMARCEGKASVQAVAIRPLGSPQEWSKSDLIQQLESIPGVRVVDDIGGVEAERFGARTSGHVALYDPQGRLMFSGGITPARGHAGDNAGSDAIVALLHGQGAGQSSGAVFGCSLMGE